MKKWKIDSKHLKIIILILLFAGFTFNLHLHAEMKELSRQEKQFLNEMESLNDHEVIIALEKRVLLNPNPRLYYILGNLCWQSEQFEKAELNFQKAIDENNSYKAAKINLAKVYLIQEKFKEAIQVLTLLPVETMHDAYLLKLLGDSYLYNADSIAAESAYRRSLLIDSNNLDVFKGLVQCLMVQEKYHQAVNITKNILEKDVYDETSWINLAKLYSYMGNYSQAIEVLLSAIALNINLDELNVLLGDLYLKENMLDDAIIMYKTLSISNKIPREKLLDVIGHLINLGEVDKAKTLFNDFIKMDASFTNTNLTKKTDIIKASFAYLTGQLVEAKKNYLKVLSEYPLEPVCLEKLGDLMREDGELELALMYYERLSRVPGNEFESLVKQGLVKVDMAKYDEAIILLENALDLQYNPDLFRYLGRVKKFSNYSHL